MLAMGGKKNAALGNSLMVQGQIQQNIGQVNAQISALENKLSEENVWTSRQLNSMNQKAILGLTSKQQNAIKFYNLDINLLKTLNPSPTTQQANNKVNPSNRQKAWFAVMGNFTKAIKIGTFNSGSQSIDIFLKNDGWFSDNQNYNYDILTNLNQNNDTSVYYNQNKNISSIKPNPSIPGSGYSCFQLTAFANSAEGTPFSQRTEKMISDLQGKKGRNQFIGDVAWSVQGGSKSKKSKKPTTKKPVSKKPTTKKPSSKKPVTKKPITKKPATKKPITKKTTTKKTISKKPKTKKAPSKK